MAEEFTPEASADFEAWVAQQAEAVNGNGAHVGPPPPEPPAQTAPPVRAQAQRTSAPHAGDPFAQLEAVARDLPLIYRELGDINSSLMRAQLTTALTLGSMLLLAVLVWKLSQVKTP